jgi:aspartate carbamoyltransferase regulatory subunit
MQEKDALQLENEILRANNFEKIMFVSEDIVINTLMHFADRATSEEPSRVVEV